MRSLDEIKSKLSELKETLSIQLKVLELVEIKNEEEAIEKLNPLIEILAAVATLMDSLRNSSLNHNFRFSYCSCGCRSYLIKHEGHTYSAIYRSTPNIDSYKVYKGHGETPGQFIGTADTMIDVYVCIKNHII